VFVQTSHYHTNETTYITPMKLTTPNSSHPPTPYFTQWQSLLVGQSHAIDAISPYIDVYRAGLSSEDRPAGVFLLLGPTGVGKTHTVETLATALHGTHRNVLTINCGEFQLEHEVARLIGAPPGYLGHRETQPLINQMKINAVASERCGLSLVLFDEIEKAAPSLQRLLLGILDKATLKLGDNTSVNFARTLIFMTANLGAKEMHSRMSQPFALTRTAPAQTSLDRTGIDAAKKHFSPEFINRIDALIPYRTLTKANIVSIVEQQLTALDVHLKTRIFGAAPTLQFTPACHEALARLGYDPLSGARELKRLIYREILTPISRLILSPDVPQPGVIRCHYHGDKFQVAWTSAAGD
jgi:ATP-dependent Clp protease ATP-binding subunit ClpA